MEPIASTKPRPRRSAARRARPDRRRRNVYYLAKFAGILGLDVQDLGAAQTGMSKAVFKARLVAQNEQPETMN